MKITFSILSSNMAAAAIYALGLATGFGQTESTTDPVGLIELSVAGGSSATPRLSLVSPTLTRPVSWQGVITAISGNTITVGGAPWAANQFNGVNGYHYVELVSVSTPAYSGTLSDITGTTASTITTYDNLSTRAVVGDSIKIRKDVTISDLLGATNLAGLLASDDASTADEVLIYNGASLASYFYYVGSPGFPAGWYKADDFSDGSKVAIAPNEAVVIKRKTSGNLSITFAGAVKTGNTLMPIQSGLNVLGTASAKGMTLSTSNLYTGNPGTGVKPSDDASTADEVLLYGANGAPTSFFYYTGSPGFPAGWYKSDDFSDANNIVIAPGTAFVLKRNNGVAFNWALPSPTSF